jgi:hypothetical protein
MLVGLTEDWCHVPVQDEIYVPGQHCQGFHLWIHENSEFFRASPEGEDVETFLIC